MGIKDYFNGGIGLSIVVSIIPIIVIFLGPNTIVYKLLQSIITFAVLCIILSFIYWFILIFFNNRVKKLSKEKMKLENKEKQLPKIKSWGNISEEIFG
jgi:undecaprenyl pyrophosphate phosphatase UppP